MDFFMFENAANGTSTEGSNVAKGSVYGKNLDFVDSEENFLNQHHGLLNPFKHVPAIQFDETGSMTVVDVPLVSEPTSCILNPRRDEALAPPSMNSVQIDQPDEAPGGQAQVTSSIQVRRSLRRRNQPIYNEQLLAARLPGLVRRRNTARDSHYRPYTNYQPCIMRASNYRRVVRDDDS